MKIRLYGHKIFSWHLNPEKSEPLNSTECVVKNIFVIFLQKVVIFLQKVSLTVRIDLQIFIIHGRSV